MKGVDTMSLFLPSNLSPNFEEVFVGNSDSENTIVFSFQVNTNGSQIRSYKIEILNELNDEEDPDENILYTEFGTFGYPLYNKDFGYIYLDLTREVEEGNSMTLSDIIVPEKDYRWRVRLYEDEIVDGGSVNINSIYGTTYIGSGNIVGTTKQVIWLDKYNDQIVEEDYVRTILYSNDTTNDYNPFNTKKTGLDEQVCVAYPKIKDGQDYVNEFEIKTNHVLPDYYDKLLDGNTYISIYNKLTQQSNDLQWQYNNKVLHIYGYGPMPKYKSTTQPWYQYRNEIEQVIIHSGITSIGNYAFYNHPALKTVIIPNELNQIGAYVFEKCQNLTSFSNSYEQKNKIVIPGSVQSIGVYAFCECKNITKLEIQEGVVSIGAAAFQDCMELDIDNVSLPQYSIKNISSSTFARTKLENAWNNDTNSDVLYVGNYLIKAKTKLVSGTYEIRSNTVSIASTAFQSCQNITKVVIPVGLKVIGQAAFQQCTGLTSVEMSNSVVDIQTQAFYKCTSLNTIKIPDSVINIGVNAFTDTGYYLNTDNWVNYVLYIGNYLIEVNPSLLGEYTIVSGTKIIADSAFYRCPNLTKLIIPDSIINIGGSALKGCTGLTSITLPFIGYSRNANKTSDAVFGYIFGSTAPSGSQTTQQYYDENYSINYYIPSSLTTVIITNTSQIPYGAFYNCNNITSIIIPDGVTKIGRDAFYNTGYYNLYSNWSSDGLYLNNNKALIKANTSFGGTYTIKPEVLVVADGAFDNVAISRMDPTLKRSYGAVWYNDQAICINHPDREQYTPKLIESLNRTNSTGHSDSVILTLPVKQAYRKDFIENNCLLDQDGSMYCNLELAYIQRQQVYAIDKSIGNMQLSKLTLDEPLEYNTFHNTTIDLKLKNNNFTRNRLYINSVREFDSKLYSSAYINLAYFEHELINTKQVYFLLTKQPDDWDTTYTQYYIANADGTYIPVERQYQSVVNAWGPQSNNAPEDWDTTYNQKYYIKNDQGEFVLNDNKTWIPHNDNLYIWRGVSWQENTYYKKRMTNIDLQDYKSSSAIQQIINYVSDTGECKLFADLPFLPDQFFMYQIFVVDTEAPNYNAANTENPYKFFAGVGYDGTQITGVFDDGLEIFREDAESEDLESKHACYLGGGYGITTSANNRFESSYKSQVYSNHQINNTNQYFCFIQPNLAIKADDYKPCSLEIYNTQYKKTLYITNYNDLQDYNIEYNKDYSIDTLDDSQWLVTLTYNEDDITNNNGGLNQTLLNDINNLITTPQTKYKIYTNYVDSIPEGYFYCRNNKVISLEYQDCYTGDILDIEDQNNYKIIYNLSRDILITCDIHDINNNTKNYVSLKSYKYTISLLNGTTINNMGDDIIKNESDVILIQSQDKQYDGRLQINLRGINILDENDQYGYSNLYRIQIEVEDELGYTHYYSEDVYFKDKEDIPVITDCISTSIDYISQTININIELPDDILQSSTVYKLLVYKQKMGSKNKQLIVSISDNDLYVVENNQIKYDGNVPTIIDYAVCNTNAYQYEVYVESIDNNDSNNIQRYLLILEEYVRPMFKMWSICDLDFIATNNMIQYGATDGHYEFIPNTKVFSIRNNIEIGEISDNLNIITYNTLGQFGRIIQNRQKFDSGSIKCMISDMQEYQKLQDCKNVTKIDISGQNINDISRYINNNSEYYNKNNYLYIADADNAVYYTYNGYQWVPVESCYALFTPKRMVDEWRYFVSNGKLKLLKSPDGYMRIVAMSQANNYSVDYKSGQYPAIISFNWQEMIDPDQIIITKGE